MLYLDTILTPTSQSIGMQACQNLITHCRENNLLTFGVLVLASRESAQKT